MRTKAILILSAAAVAFAAPASAHHSGAMFDATKTETVAGTVKEYQWTNPHSWLFVMTDEATYNVELTSPNLLARRGWRPASFKVGDKVTVALNPFRDGRKGGRVVSVTKADGTVFTERGPA